MARPTTREEFKEYIKRRLGEPVITVNVADEQLSERVDDALAYYADMHYAASEKLYLRLPITYSNLTFVADSTGTFANGEYVRGETSNAIARVNIQPTANTLQYTHLTSDAPVKFQVGETLRGQHSNATGEIQTITLGVWDQQWIPISNSVLDISKILQHDGLGFGRGNMFSFSYQWTMQEFTRGGIPWLASGSLVSYYLMRSTVELLGDLLWGDTLIRYNRHQHRLYIDRDWNVSLRPGEFVVVEATAILDPEMWPEIWQDRFLLEYCTALVKRQWGQNLSKYSGIAMPGGTVLNGQELYTEAVREITELEQQAQDKWSLPVGFIVA